jgi:hypothetical protein
MDKTHRISKMNKVFNRFNRASNIQRHAVRTFLFPEIAVAPEARLKEAPTEAARVEADRAAAGRT